MTIKHRSVLREKKQVIFITAASRTYSYAHDTHLRAANVTNLYDASKIQWYANTSAYNLNSAISTRKNVTVTVKVNEVRFPCPGDESIRGSRGKALLILNLGIRYSN
jgi:hypothetical protein